MPQETDLFTVLGLDEHTRAAIEASVAAAPPIPDDAQTVIRRAFTTTTSARDAAA